MLHRISNICFLAWGLFAIASFAKSPEWDLSNMSPPQVRLEYTPGPLHAGGALLVHVRIDSGWHINSQSPGDEFLLPTTIEAKALGIQFAPPQWPPAETLYSEALALETSFFAGSFTIRLPIEKLATTYDSLSTQATLHYQACSHSICLAPNKVEVQLGFPLDKKKEPSPSLKSSPPLSLALMLLFAFLGGILLNLMPCVLPVLSLKALSLARHAHESRRRLLSYGFAMTLGILASFWALALILVIVQQAGVQAGWGFQFQNPAFLVAMTILITLVALNLFGVFEIWLPSSTQTELAQRASGTGIHGAFLNGALMTLLSTPCSAPFLGTAMGFAFSQPPVVLFLFFTTVGLGLATPFLLLSVFPRSLRWIPKPGEWMLRFKEFLGFLMLVTAVWLIWVFGRAVGLEAMGALLLLLIAIGFGAWILGLAAAPGNPFWRLVLGWIILAAIGFGGWIAYLHPLLQTPPQSSHCDNSQPDSQGYRPWSPQLVAQLQNQGKTIFVNFTADWCITCKTNEKAVLSQEEVRNAFAELDVVLLKADFTRPNPEISASLRSFGRSGVPLYVLYPGNTPSAPLILPEILTRDMVLDALQQAGASVPNE